MGELPKHDKDGELVYFGTSLGTLTNLLLAPIPSLDVPLRHHRESQGGKNAHGHRDVISAIGCGQVYISHPSPLNTMPV